MAAPAPTPRTFPGLYGSDALAARPAAPPSSPDHGGRTAVIQTRSHPPLMQVKRPIGDTNREPEETVARLAGMHVTESKPFMTGAVDDGANDPLTHRVTREEQLRLLAAAALPDPVFDVIIGWVPLVEEIVAAECYGNPQGYTLLAMKPHGQVFKDEHLELCKGKRVLVCGSYFSDGELDRLALVAARVDAWLYCDGDVLRSNTTKHFRGSFHIDLNRFPRALRLIRRALEPKSPHAEDDEHFYRGLMHHGYAESFTHEEVVRCWLRGGWTLTEEELIQDGVTIAVEHDRVAEDIVRVGSKAVAKELHMKVDTTKVVYDNSDSNPAKWTEKAGLVTFETKVVPIKIRLVVAGPVLIMPVARALVRTGADVGVVVRYNLEQDTTSVTFYTESGTDLRWVDPAPWNGGGRPECKGTTLPTLLPIADLLAWLQLPA